MANSPPPWATYRTLMAYHLVALDKRPGVLPVGIGETLCRALAKLVMRAAGNQAKTVCGNFHLCAGLKDGIEGENRAVGPQRLERVRERRSMETAGSMEEEKEETDTVEAEIKSLTIETAGTQKEVAEHLEAVLGMEVEETGEG